MNPGALYHLLRADFLERVRSYRFMIVQLLAVVLGYAAATEQVNLLLGSYRGIYNAAWVGLLMAMSAAVFFTWFGFYVVRGSVERDYRTGVGQILATTPLNRVLYTFGKTLSNFAILVVMTLILALAGLLMVWLRGEGSVEIWPLLSPFLLISLPPLAVTAAVAVLFETVRWLRGGFGNVVYFFAFAISMPLVGEALLGLDLVAEQVGAIITAFDPAYEGGIRLGVEVGGEVIETFIWPGFDWAAAIVGMRLAYFLLAAGLALVAAMVFDRFDPARVGRAARAVPRLASDETVPNLAKREHVAVHVERLPPEALQTSAVGFFAQILVLELRLLLKGQRWWWYVAAAGLLVAQFTAPLASVRQVLLPLAWIWPVLVWSRLGSREWGENTVQLVFSVPRPLRQLGPAWLAGFLLAALTGAGAGVRMLAGGEPAIVGWLAGAMFIPSLALALGVVSRGSRLFEIVYLLFWYIGPMNQTPALDYLAALDETLQRGLPAVYLTAAAGLLLLAVWWRRRELGGS